MATHPLPNRIGNLGQEDKFTVNTPVPHASFLQSHLYIWYCSQECRVKQLHWGQASPMLLAEVRFSSRLYCLRQRPCFCGTLFFWDFPPPLLRVDLQLYLTRGSALGTAPFHHSGRTSVLLSPPTPACWKRWRLCLDAAGQSRPGRRSCCAGASQVHMQSALKDTVFEKQRANRISGHCPPSSNLIKQGWLPIKKEKNSLSCVLEPTGKLLTAQHCH